MKIYRLSVILPDYPGWRYSQYCGNCIVRAESEGDARIAAMGKYIQMAEAISGQDFAAIPWNQEHVVACIEDTSDEFTHNGPPEILFPKDEQRIPADMQEASL